MIETERLLLRAWRDDDAAAHRGIVTHPLVIRTLGEPSDEPSTAVVARQNAWLDQTGSCFWAVEAREGGAVIGWCGIKPGPAGTPIESRPEAGWTIHPDHWGQGLAREAAEAVLARHWRATDDARVWAITTPGNAASWGLMERLGMTRVTDGEFHHPNLAEGHPLRRHLTYAIGRPA